MARRRRGRGEDSVYQREEDGLWVASVSLGYTDKGKRKRKVVYGTTKAEAVEKRDRLKADVRAGTLSDAGGLTVGQFLDRWLVGTADGKADRTVEQRERLVRVHIRPRLGGVKLAKLTPLHVESFYAELRDGGVGPGAARDAAVALNMALKHASG